ncbi:class I SAM-dependent methyltransferase [Luteibacter yeojuensis]
MSERKLKVSGGATDDHGLVVGNTFDKYGSANPVVKWMMKGFDSAMSELVDIANPEAIYEVGCGEGYWILKWRTKGIRASGCDISQQVVELARENTALAGVPEESFEQCNIYDLERPSDPKELIVCCEVLEHIDDPLRGLEALHRIAGDFVILSVPREPLWRALNVVRGKYLHQLGNTPGHIQHWSSRSFQDFVSQVFEIIEVRRPLPWTMLLCRRRG